MNPQMHYFKTYVFTFFFSVSLISFSQSENKMDVNTDIDLVKVYAQVVKEGYGTVSIYKELANGYYFRSNYAESKKWFEKLFSEVEVKDPLHIYRYKQSLKALKIYTENNFYLSERGTN